MANLTESPIYEPGIFQLEKSTPPLGGAPVIDNGVPSAGHANAQGLQLANRTAWLKQQVDTNLLPVTDATVTPTANKIVRADSSGKIDVGWLPELAPARSGVNLIPAEMSVFNSVPPETTANGGATHDTVSDPTALKGFALRTSWTTTTGQALILAKDYTLDSTNIPFERKKYIVSFWARASVAGHQVGAYLRLYQGDSVTTITSSAPLFTLTTDWVRYSAVIDMTSTTYTGSRMALVLQQNRSNVAGRTVWYDRIMLEAVDNTTTIPSTYSIGNSFDQVENFSQQSIETHERLIFKKKKILSLPLKNPEWDYLVGIGVRFYPQTFCVDEYSQKLLIIDGVIPNKTVLVYDWPSGTFDRVFFCSGGLVSESAVVRVEGSTKYLYLRTTGDKLAKYDITTYPASRSVIPETVITTAACGLNFMERNGYWTFSDIANSPLGNVRSRGKFIKTDSSFNVIGSVDCGDYLMGIYAGRSGDTDVTKAQGVTDNGYGIVGQMGGQWVYPNTVTNYSQNGIRVFTYDGNLVAEGLLQADKFRSMISANWGFTPDLIEAEGITTLNNGDVFSLVVTSNNGLTNASAVHGMLIMQEFAEDGLDFSPAASSRLGTFQSRGALTTTPSGAVLIDPTTNTVITTIQQLLVAMQKAGLEKWSMYTTAMPIVDTAGAAYPTGCLLTVTMFRSDIFFTQLVGFGVNIRKRIYYDTGTSAWIEGQSYNGDGINTFSASGLAIVRTTGGPTLTMSGPVTNHRQILGQTSGVVRWRLSLGDSSAESSGDLGSNFALASYTDAGVFKAAAFQVMRSTGETQVTQFTSTGPIKPGQYTLTTLPSASTFNGYEIDVTNATGGPKRCRSNGTVWQILNTTTTVS